MPLNDVLAVTTTFLVAASVLSLDHIKLIFPCSFVSRNPQSADKVAQQVQLQQWENIPIPAGAFGPESFAFDPDGGGPYTGISDGRIIKWLANETRWVDFAVTSPERRGCVGPHDHTLMEPTCGRPLGLRFNEQTRELYVADAYMGLLVVGPNGGLARQLSTEAEDLPFGFTNSLDIDQSNGQIYFTDSSTQYHRRNYAHVILSGDNTGRLLNYDPKTRKTRVVATNLMFPNGVALSRDGDFLLVAETTTTRIFKIWLKFPKAGTIELIAKLPGFPDNIKRNQKGDQFWVGMSTRTGKMFQWGLSKYPWLGRALLKIPLDYTRLHSLFAHYYRGCGLAVKLNEYGRVLEILEDGEGKTWRDASEVEERNGSCG